MFITRENVSICRGVNKGRLPAFAGGNVLLAGGKISDRPVEISILANILSRLQFHLIYLAKKGEVTSLNSLFHNVQKCPLSNYHFFNSTFMLFL